MDALPVECLKVKDLGLVADLPFSGFQLSFRQLDQLLVGTLLCFENPGIGRPKP
jgi:hypothetical protein